MVKSGSTWTPKEEAFVRRNYKKLTTKEIAARLGRPYGGVTWKIHQMDLPNELNDHFIGSSVYIQEDVSAVPMFEPSKKPWWKFWA